MFCRAITNEVTRLWSRKKNREGTRSVSIFPGLKVGSTDLVTDLAYVAFWRLRSFGAVIDEVLSKHKNGAK